MIDYIVEYREMAGYLSLLPLNTYSTVFIDILDFTFYTLLPSVSY